MRTLVGMCWLLMVGGWEGEGSCLTAIRGIESADNNAVIKFIMLLGFVALANLVNGENPSQPDPAFPDLRLHISAVECLAHIV